VNRRSFFATLLAPLVARFAPKPIYRIGETIHIRKPQRWVAYRDNGHLFYSEAESIQRYKNNQISALAECIAAKPEPTGIPHVLFCDWTADCRVPSKEN
jgi:hypothetical protein